MNQQNEERWAAQGEMLVNRVLKNKRKLSRWLTGDRISCYRLYDRDIPEIPLAVDWYDGNLHLAMYAGKIPAEEAGGWMGAMASVLGGALGVRSDRVFTKVRHKGRGGSQYQRQGQDGEMIQVKENGLCFLVNLSDYLDTGLFLDHRRTREMVRDEAQGKRFLNLFAYTGSFSVYAAAGGAASTTTVDLSNTYLDWAQQNMIINGFKGEDHRFVKDDVLGALTKREARGMYDLIVLDPPTVSKSKGMKQDLDVQRDYMRMIGGALRVCSPGGVIYFSTNLRAFKPQWETLRGGVVDEISDLTVPADFRDRRIHRCFRILAN